VALGLRSRVVDIPGEGESAQLSYSSLFLV
jgi:hypothetical protein